MAVFKDEITVVSISPAKGDFNGKPLFYVRVSYHNFEGTYKTTRDDLVVGENYLPTLSWRKVYTQTGKDRYELVARCGEHLPR